MVGVMLEVLLILHVVIICNVTISLESILSTLITVSIVLPFNCIETRGDKLQDVTVLNVEWQMVSGSF